MNKIYRLVWSRKEQALVVASEFAKSDSTGKTATVKIGRTGGLVLAGAMALLATGGAMAGSLDGGTATGLNAVAVGPTSSATAQNTVAIGSGAVTSGAEGVAIGKLAEATASNTVAIGNDATSSGTDAVAIGFQSAANGVNSFVLGNQTTSNALNSIAIGGNSVSTVAVDAGSAGSISLGRNAIITNSQNAELMGINGRITNANNGVGIGAGVSVTATNAIAIGQASSASGGDSVAIGSGATASNGDAVAIGRGAQASGTNGSFAVGNAEATGLGSISIGESGSKAYHAVASGIDAVGVGNGSQATAQGAAAFGTSAKAKGVFSTALGIGTDADGEDSLAAGRDAESRFKNSTALGAFAKAEQEDAVALGHNSVTKAAVGTSSATIADTTYNYAGTAPSSTVSVGNVNAERTITNVAAGRVSATSTDAVNGSQLNATHQEVTAIDKRVDTLGTNTASHLGGGSTYNPATGELKAPTYNVGGDTYNNVGDALTNVDGRTINNTTNLTNLTNQINNGTIGLVQQDPTSRDITVAKATDGKTVNFTGTAGERVLAGVDKGKAGTDAVNVSQLKGVTDALGGGSTVNPDGSVKAPTYNVDNRTFNNVGDALTNVDGRVTNVDNRVTNLGDQITNGTIGLVQQDPTSRDITVAKGTDGKTVNFTGTAGERVLAGVDEGAVTATSKEAVNGSQLYGTNKSITDALGGGSSVNPDGSIKGPTYNVDNRTFTNVGDALTNVDGRVTNNTNAINNINNGGGIKYFHANSTKADSTATGVDSVAVGPVANASAANAVAVGNGATAGQAGAVALGAGSTTAAAVATASGTVAGTSYNYAGTAPASTVSVGAAGAERTVTNVAAGRVSASSTDAVNGSQLNATNQAVEQVDGRVTNVDNRVTNLGDQINNGTVGLVQQDPTSRDITVAKATDGKAVNFTGTAGERVLAGVDKGKADTDAVNVSQLKGVTDALGGGSTVNPDGSVKAPTYNIDNRTFNNVGDALTNVDGRVTNLGDQINNGSVGVVQQDPASRDITVAKGTDGSRVDFTGTAGERVLAGVDAGVVSATSKEAVNGSQLYGTNKSITDALGGGSSVNPDGSIKGPTFNVDNRSYSNVGDAITAVDGRVTNIDGRVTNVEGTLNNINNGGGIKYFHANSTKADSTATGVDSVAVGPAARSAGLNAVAVGNGASAAGRGALAAGTGSDASGVNSTAVGVGARAINTDSTALGLSSSATGAGGTALGVGTNAAGNASLASGRDSDALSNQSVAVGYNATAGSTTGGANAAAFGANSSATGTGSLALGADSKAAQDGAVALGNGSSTAAAVATTSGTIAGKSYGYAGTAPTSTVSVGAVGAERTVTNVAAGRVSGSSTDAVNGSQLFATNQAVDTLDGRVTDIDGRVTNIDGRVTNVEGTLNNINNGGGIKYFHANSTKADSTAAGNDSIAVGPQANASGDSAVAMGAGSVAAGGFSTALGQNAKANGGNAIALGQATSDAERGIAIGTNGDAPAIDVDSREAVAIGDHVKASKSIEAVVLGAGASATNAQESVAIGNDAAVSAADAVAIGNSSIASHKGAVALGAGAETSEAVTTASGSIAGTTYTYAGVAESTVSVGKAGHERSITHVAAGRVTAASTDAVNGSQLFATNQAVDKLDGEVKQNTTDITNLTNNVNNISNGGGIKYFHANSTAADSTAIGTDSVAIGPQANASAKDAVAMGNGAQATHANSVALGAGTQTTVGAQASYEGAFVGQSSSTGEVAVGGRKITGVAAGNADTDAVNVSQLNAGVTTAIDQSSRYTDARISEVNTNVGGAVTNIENLQKGADGMFQVSQDNTVKPTVKGPNSTAGGANAQATGANSTAVGANTKATADNSVAVGVNSVADRANSVSVGAAGQERQVVNVAAGTSETDAVNVGQLRQSTAGSVRYDSNADGSVNPNSLTLNPGGTPATVGNVADGVRSNDAVNVGQLNRAVGDLRADQFDLRRESRGGTASALAAAGLPQANGAGKHMLAAGVGGYEGEVALAVGLSGVTDNNRYIYKAQVTSGTTKDFGFSVGAGIQW